MAVYHHASIAKWTNFLPFIEGVGNFLNRAFDVEIRNSSRLRSEFKSLGHHAIELNPVFHPFYLLSNDGTFQISHNVCSSSSLRHTIVGSIDDSPLYNIAEISKRRKNDCKVAPSLSCRRIEQTVHILKENVLRPLVAFLVENTIYLPP